LIDEVNADFVVVNCENSAGGFGVSEFVAKRLLAIGVDVLTSGNHVWEKRDVWSYLDEEPRLLRPANYPPSDSSFPIPGKGCGLYEKAGVKWAVINLQGRDGMPMIDCPFRLGRALVEQQVADGRIILIDFHAESSREKESLAWYLDGLASALVGTHTHVQTADERVLPKGTAYVTDLGMTGPSVGVIGMSAEICANRSKTQVPYRMECAAGPSGIRGVLVSIDVATRLAKGIERVCVNLP